MPERATGTLCGVTYTVRQTAAMLGVSGGSVYKLMRIGQLTFLRVGARKLPLRESVDAFIALNTVTETPAPCHPRRKRDWSILYS